MRRPPACCVITLPGRVELSVDSSYNAEVPVGGASGRGLPGRVELSVDSSYNAEVPDSQCTRTHMDNLEIHNFLYTAEREVC